MPPEFVALTFNSERETPKCCCASSSISDHAQGYATLLGTIRANMIAEQMTLHTAGGLFVSRSLLGCAGA